MTSILRQAPGRVRDAILNVLQGAERPLAVDEIVSRVRQQIPSAASSSVRSYLRLNTPTTFKRIQLGTYSLRERDIQEKSTDWPQQNVGKATVVNSDSFEWLEQREENSVHAVVTDPPYGLVEYTDKEQSKLRAGKGGNWRVPPALGGYVRSPVPRFTTLSESDLNDLDDFFMILGALLRKVLVPGGNVIMASNPLLSHRVATALARGGLENRGAIARLVMTMRGGDRPKNAHEEFAEVSVLPRSMWEPWVVMRKPLEGRVQDNLRKWNTGGFRRPSDDRPFGDVIQSAPTHASEKRLANHPSLKPQAFLRQVVRASLPLAKGTILDPFAGSGSTLAACNYHGFESIGIEKDPDYYQLATEAIVKLAAYKSK